MQQILLYVVHFVFCMFLICVAVFKNASPMYNNSHMHL
jgi:hypothetical protein